MACCAFALYLLTQLLAPLGWLRDRLIGAPTATASASVAWSPGATASATATAMAIAAPVSRRRGLLLAILALEIVGAGVAVAAPAALPADDAARLAQLHQSLCSSVFGRSQ